MAKEERRDLVKNKLLTLIEVTSIEKGCISYDLYQDNENPNLFLFYENLESKVLWQEHMKNEQLAR